MKTVAVLGAGLQGSCVALELAARGIAVDLVDQRERAVSQASAANEGRIHLGYVYSNDPSLETARLMARGALSFAPFLRRFIGDDLDRIPVSAPYYYAVHRDSLVPVDRVASHLAACGEIIRDEAGAGPVDYFGLDCLAPPRRIATYDHLFNPLLIEAVFLTPEIALDPQCLAVEMRAALARETGIRGLFGATVTDVATDTGGAEVETEVAGERLRRRYDAVVNTLWDGRLALDARLGLTPSRAWLYRMKYFVRGTPPATAPAIPSSTIVLGPFGAAVRYGDGEVYLSWYPAGMRATSAATRPPEWPRRLDGVAGKDLAQATLAALGQIVPAVAVLSSDSLASCRVEGGVIFAWGESDIDDPSSGLHQRSGIGVRSKGSYHSIDTGKLSMAPLFARTVADRIAP